MLKYPKGGVRKKTSIENNIGGARNTTMENTSGSAMHHKTTVSIPKPHQSSEEALIYQVRETATRI